MKKILISMIIISLILTSCQASVATNNESISLPTVVYEDAMIDVDDMLEDMDIMKAVYLAKNLSHRDDDLVTQFNSEFNNIYHSLNEPKSLDEFYIEIAKLAALTKDGHANPRNTNEQFILPYGFTYLQEGLVVHQASRNQQLNIGDTIISINHIPTEDLLEKSKAIFSFENLHGLQLSFSRMITNRSVLDYLNCIDENGYVPIEIRRINGEIYSFNLKLLRKEKKIKKVVAETITSLPFTLKIVENKLIVEHLKTNHDFIKKDDEIVSINGKASKEVVSLFKTMIPKKQLEKNIISLPDAFLTKSLFEKLDLIDNNDELSIQILDYDKEITVDFLSISTNKKQSPQSNLSYTLLEDKNAGILVIPQCQYDKKAEDVLKEFFDNVHKLNIDHVILDLRTNTGGKTQIIDEFLKYIAVDEVEYWKNTVIDFGTKTIPHPYLPLFDGQLYVATSKSTLSSALMMTATLKYNNLAKTIGEPTGQSTQFYGRASTSTLPNSGIIIGTTTVTVYMQNKKYPNTIEPDIPLPTTIYHLINDKDPIIEWINTF